MDSAAEPALGAKCYVPESEPSRRINLRTGTGLELKLRSVSILFDCRPAGSSNQIFNWRIGWDADTTSRALACSTRVPSNDFSKGRC